MKREPTVWENTFANDTSNKGLISKIYKELYIFFLTTAYEATMKIKTIIFFKSLGFYGFYCF